MYSSIRRTFRRRGNREQNRNRENIATTAITKMTPAVSRPINSAASFSVCSLRKSARIRVSNCDAGVSGCDVISGDDVISVYRQSGSESITDGTLGGGVGVASVVSALRCWVVAWLCSAVKGSDDNGGPTEAPVEITGICGKVGGYAI